MEPLSIIILTFNEEKNLPGLLDSLQGIVAPVFVVDSFSTDGTLAILQERAIEYIQHPFENYSRQRNWAQVNTPYASEWVLHLDAGERVTPELVDWLRTRFDPRSEQDGYMFSRRTLFFDRWIKHGGHYPNYHLRLYRVTKGRCEDKVYDQHFVVDGSTEPLPAGIDIIDTVTDTLLDFSRSHTRWALFEAIEIVSQQRAPGEVEASLWGSPIERRRWLKSRVFQKAPLFLRSFLYFNYRYFLRLGFLDGTKGLVFHFLQGFWFRFLVDANVVEIQHYLQKTGLPLRELIVEKYGEAYLKAISE